MQGEEQRTRFMWKWPKARGVSRMSSRPDGSKTCRIIVLRVLRSAAWMYHNSEISEQSPRCDYDRLSRLTYYVRGTRCSAGLDWGLI